MLRMVSYSRRPQSGHIVCYLNRTYHVLTTHADVPHREKKNSMLHCRTLLVPISWSQSVLIVFPRKGTGHAIRHRAETRHLDRTHRRPDAAGGVCRNLIRLEFRVAWLVAGIRSAAGFD